MKAAADCHPRPAPAYTPGQKVWLSTKDLPLHFHSRKLATRQPAVTRTVKKWSEEAEEALKDCFNTTLWDVFSDAHGEDIDSLTHCLMHYINFCVENTVPTRTVRSFSNSKPWITPDIKALLKEKRRAFVSGNIKRS
ncbi:hypothetical protein L3Q82_016612 [Scortum barcoo]|uniref:Uncharacterized protein n=1 Tax=Scortum barcoo TaxID=214431 RepID=A0ACB8X7M6_9TELE|nr:hypothetical protein L3Q82_016612 [Scortum barcoo]